MQHWLWEWTPLFDRTIALQGLSQRGSPDEIRKSSDNEEEGGMQPCWDLTANCWGRSFHIEGSAKARCWASAVLVRGTIADEGDQRTVEGEKRYREKRFSHQVTEVFSSKTLLSSCNQEQYTLYRMREASAGHRSCLHQSCMLIYKKSEGDEQ